MILDKIQINLTNMHNVVSKLKEILQPLRVDTKWFYNSILRYNYRSSVVKYRSLTVIKWTAYTHHDIGTSKFAAYTIRQSVWWPRIYPQCHVQKAIYSQLKDYLDFYIIAAIAMYTIVSVT